jgi:sterol desaturase/sphingolipid hydroxylase (fatty acid hydroxylase superfamily)
MLMTNMATSAGLSFIEFAAHVRPSAANRAQPLYYAAAHENMSQILPIAVALCAVCALGGVAVAVESRYAADRRSLWRAARLNLAYYFATASFTTPFMLFAAPAIVALVNRAGGGFILLPANGWRFAGSVLVILLATDALEYAYHRLQHALPLLWRLHSFHHSEEQLNATTSLRQIWFDTLVRGFVLFPIVGILFRVDPAVIVVVRLITTINSMQVHMSWRLSWGPLWWFLNSPQYHRCHHSFAPNVIDKNLAPMFPLWDIAFGTCHKPEPGEYDPTGLRPSVRPSLVAALLWPFPYPRP